MSSASVPEAANLDTSTSRDEEHPVARSTGRPLRTLYMSRATADEFDRRWLEMAAMGVRQRSGRA